MTDRKAVFQRLLALLPTGAMVDLGTGHGRFARAAADRGWKVTAVDARDERWPEDERIAWVRSDIRDHDLDSYDVVSCLGIFYHLTCADQVNLLRRCTGKPMIIDTHIDQGEHRHNLSDRVINELGYEGRYYTEPGKTTSSWLNERSFWPTMPSFHRMLGEHGFSLILTVDPWHQPDRTFFLALPD